MRKIDTAEYMSSLRQLTEQGHEVQLLVSGNSMSPFLIHQRDSVYFKKPKRKLRSGDIVFYQRKNGQFVMHRIWKVKSEGYYIVGDAQRVVEGPIFEDQIFGLITKVRRKGKWITKGNIWWEFFEHIWIHMLPVREIIMKIYGKF